MVTLNVHNLCKHFGRHRVLNDISFSHSKGVLGIVGANGSGKSTLLQCLTGLLNISKGRVEWCRNEEMIALPQIKLQLGFVAPYISLYPNLSCRENLDFLLKLRNHTARRETIKAVLKKTQAMSLADQPFGNLSTGQQQRIRLASALVHQPEILFLDEPGSNLDKKGAALVKELVAQFSAEQKLVIIASNRTKELTLCDTLYSVEEASFV